MKGWWDKLMKAPMTRPVESAEELDRGIRLANERAEKLRKTLLFDNGKLIPGDAFHEAMKKIDRDAVI